MAIIRKTFCFGLVLLLSSCSILNKTKAFDKEALALMVHGYYYHFGEYPDSLDCFLDFYSDQDSVSNTVSYLTNNKKHITWFLNDTTFLKEELTVKERNDTLLWISEDKFLPFFHDLILSYRKDYLEYPKTLEDLINYDYAIQGKREELFDRCIGATLGYLEKYNDQITWQINDSLCLIRHENDTLIYRYGPPYSEVVCNSDYWREKIVYLFFDQKGTAVISDEILYSFIQGLRNIVKNYKNETFDISEYHILKYERPTGLQLFCKGDTISLETDWFMEVGAYLDDFSMQHDLSKIIFTSWPYQKLDDD